MTKGLSVKFGITNTFVSAFLLSMLLYFYIQPTYRLSDIYSIMVVFVIQIAAIFTAKILSSGTVRQSFVKVLAVSVVYGSVIYYILKPSAQLSLSQIIILTSLVEFMGLMLTLILTHTVRAPKQNVQ